MKSMTRKLTKLPTIPDIVLTARNSSRSIKKIILLLADITTALFSLVFSFALYAENYNFLWTKDFYISFLFCFIFLLISLNVLGFYRLLVRYFTLAKIGIVALSSASSSLALAFSTKILGNPISPIIPVTFCCLLFLGVVGVRKFLTDALDAFEKTEPKRIAVFGATKLGAQLIQALHSNPAMRTVKLFDDDPSLIGRKLGRFNIEPVAEIQDRLKESNVKALVIAKEDLLEGTKQTLINSLSELNIEVKIFSGMQDIISDHSHYKDLKNYTVDDLLGRKSTKPDPRLMRKNISDRSILVTGAGGSIGSEICRQALDCKPDVMVLLDLSEHNLYTVLQELSSKSRDQGVTLIPIIGSVSNEDLLKRILLKYDVHIVFHAAAYKHVPLIEHNILSGIENNVLGTKTLLNCLKNTSVKNFTLISTDKAVRPKNFMGASKRLAELACQHHQWQHKDLNISIVRFGNVLNSSGSVVPLFQSQISNGGPITLTDEKITRYFMTIPEAAQLVIQASALSSNGNTYVLDMGEPVSIKDLATNMVLLSGFTPVLNSVGANKIDGSIEIKVVGLRPGEKLYEELSYDDHLSKTSHHQIWKANEDSPSPEEIAEIINQVERAVTDQDLGKLITILSTVANSLPSMEDCSDLIHTQPLN